MTTITETAEDGNAHPTAQIINPASIESAGKTGVSNRNRKDLLKESISFKSLAESDGRQFKRSGAYWMCRCPFHHDKTPSFAVHQEDDQVGRCFGCGWYGDVFNYVMSRTGCDFRTAYIHLATAGTLHGTKRKRAAPPAPAEDRLKYQFTADELKEINQAKGRLLNEDWLCEKIAGSRQWKPSTIRGLATSSHLGWCGDALAFIYETGIKVRRWPGKEFYWWAGDPHIWRADRIDSAKKVFITEGEPDAITLIDAGFEKDAAIAVVAAPSASTFPNSWAEFFKDKEVVLCFDADDAGRAGASRVGTLLLPVAKSISEWTAKEVA